MDTNYGRLEASQLTSEKIKITEHDPKGSTTIEKDVPKKSGGNWKWIIIGAAVLAGAVAALAGGSSSSSDSSESAPNTGNFEATW